MAGSCCGFGDSADRHFDAAKVETELARYRKRGPGPTTRGLRKGVLSAGLHEGSLLDIGGGLGILSLELLDAGFSQATVVDTSSAFLATASRELAHAPRFNAIRFVHGDFLVVSADLADATVVMLDRVVCCYPSYQPLLEQALRHAERGFAMSYPRDRWFVRLGFTCENAMRRRKGDPFRAFVHPPAHLQQLVEAADFRLASRVETIMWSADVYVKDGRDARS